MATIRISEQSTGTILAEGPKGWGITPFEGNLYIRKKYLKTDGFKVNYIPGLCVYKFLYVWLNLNLKDHSYKNIAWLYWLPNPLFPFVWYRVGIPAIHPALNVEYLDSN